MDAIAPKVEVLPKLIGGWSVERPVCYVVTVLLLALAIRVILSVFKAVESDQPFRTTWKDAFWGVGKSGDHWQPFLLGLLELGTFPILMFTENWSFIGAWVGFKVVAQATVWKEKREVFSRFLIGTALGLVVSFTLASFGFIVSK